MSERTEILTGLAALGRSARWDDGNRAWLDMLPADLRPLSERNPAPPGNIGAMVDHDKLLDPKSRKLLKGLAEKAEAAKTAFLAFNQAEFNRRLAAWHADIAAGRGQEFRDAAGVKDRFKRDARGSAAILSGLFSEAWPMIQGAIGAAVAQLLEAFIFEVTAERERYANLGLTWQDSDASRALLAIDAAGKNLATMLTAEMPARTVGATPGDRLRAAGLGGLVA